MGCKFCHASDFIGKVKVRPVDTDELLRGILAVSHKMNLRSDRTLLISYMGCGEPMESIHSIIGSMRFIMDHPDIWGENHKRFAIATCLPKMSAYNMLYLASQVMKYKIPLKMHLSLHYTEDKTRQEYMPAATDIEKSMYLMEMYSKSTGNAVEIHYSLMSGVNDTGQDISRLIQLVDGTGFNVKFLYHNVKENVEWDNVTPAVVSSFMKALSSRGIDCEYYVPPGLDIGASCGQFLMERYAEAEARNGR
jgi:adenine C2-methylase RlmN of 23S rRNA A2503 and tRNA A37